jgi:hypothetical protein
MPAGILARSNLCATRYIPSRSAVPGNAFQSNETPRPQYGLPGRELSDRGSTATITPSLTLDSTTWRSCATPSKKASCPSGLRCLSDPQDQGKPARQSRSVRQHPSLTSHQCDGVRPICQECLSRDSPCQYTETETVLLKRKHEDLEALLQMLKTYPEEEAHHLLARIRTGIDPGVLVEQVRHSSLLMSLASRGSSGQSRGSPEMRSHSQSS